MSAAAVHSILARCLLDARFCNRLIINPSSVLRPFGLDARAHADFLAIDLDRIRRLSGQITKVQLNGLWQWFLSTRLLIKHYGIESDVFTAFREIHQNCRSNASSNRVEQTSRFLVFLNDFIDQRGERAYPGLRDVLGHEECVWNVNRSLSQNAPLSESRKAAKSSKVGAFDFDAAVPVIQGEFCTRQFKYDPIKIVAALKRGRFRRPYSSPRGGLVLGYWADPTAGDLKVLRLDSLAARTLSLINGKYPVRTVISRTANFRRGAMGASAVRRIIKNAIGTGLLAIRLSQSSEIVSPANMFGQ